MKDSFKITFLLDGKKLSLAGVLEKYIRKCFVLAKKFVSTTRNEVFIEKYVSIKRKNCSFWHENPRKWFPLAGKYFSDKIGFP